MLETHNLKVGQAFKENTNKTINDKEAYMKPSTKRWLKRQAKEWCEAAVSGTIVAVFLIIFFLLALLMPSKRDECEETRYQEYMENVTYNLES